MQRRGIVNSLVAAVAILITSGLAAQAVVRGPSTSDDSELVAAGVDGRGSFAIDSQAATNDTRPTASTQPRPLPVPRLTTTTPQASVTPVTTVPVGPETTVPPVTAAPIPPPTDMPTVNWPPVAPPPPPVVVQTGPASWSFQDKGITVTASVSPEAPRAGDTITVSFTTGGDGENCCRAVVFVAGGAQMIGHTLRTAGDPCQPSPVTSGTGTVVVSEPGPFTFDVQATRDPAGCPGPFEFTNVGLSATVEVLPALPAA